MKKNKSTHSGNFVNKNRKSIYGGICATVFTGLGAFLLGDISGYEAKILISTSLSGILMLCRTIVLASATILTLLLTLLSISIGTKSHFKKEHYQQVLTIAKFDTVLIIGALVLFQFFNIPITESQNLPTAWFSYIYWATLFFSSVLSGLMVTVILLLYTTVTNIISIVGMGKDHYLVEKEDIKNEKSQEIEAEEN